MASIYYGNNKYSGAGGTTSTSTVTQSNSKSISTGTFYYVKLADL